ncbi:MAG: transcriptional regulator [Planctomycetes bacterium]|nr:transcriptional regulator [Planctomycetota bacterium]MBM4082587.1 transcriptional regulator [Planctomycetota bacterium]
MAHVTISRRDAVVKLKSQSPLQLVEKHGGIIRPSDFRDAGIPTVYLTRLCEKRVLERVGRGLYRLVDMDVTERHGLAEAAKRIPNGVVCLLSALVFHDLTDENPFEVWVAIDMKAWRPKVEYPPVRFCRFSGAALTQGIEQHRMEGVAVQVYSPEKTLADCLKYRNKIGLDVAVKALRRYLSRRGKMRLGELMRFARVCRVEKLMRRYVEAVL